MAGSNTRFRCGRSRNGRVGLRRRLRSWRLGVPPLARVLLRRACTLAFHLGIPQLGRLDLVELNLGETVLQEIEQRGELDPPLRRGNRSGEPQLHIRLRLLLPGPGRTNGPFARESERIQIELRFSQDRRRTAGERHGRDRSSRRRESRTSRPPGRTPEPLSRIAAQRSRVLWFRRAALRPRRPPSRR